MDKCTVCNTRNKKKGDLCRRCNSIRNKLLHRIPQLKDRVDQINSILEELDIKLEINNISEVSDKLNIGN